MKCHNCEKAAMWGTGPGGGIPLCLDCYAKLVEIQTKQQENMERYLNHLHEDMESSVGLASYKLPRFPPRRSPTVLKGNVTLHNINVSNSSIGVVNTGSIGSIDSAITLMKSEGAAEVAKAFQSLTEAILATTSLEPAAKGRALETVSVLAAEAATPTEKRRRFAMKPLLLDLSTVLGGAASLAQIWTQVQPVIEAAFR